MSKRLISSQNWICRILTARHISEFSWIYYDRGGSMAFKEFIDSMAQLAKGINGGQY